METSSTEYSPRGHKWKGGIFWSFFRSFLALSVVAWTTFSKWVSMLISNWNQASTNQNMFFFKNNFKFERYPIVKGTDVGLKISDGSLNDCKSRESFLERVNHSRRKTLSQIFQRRPDFRHQFCYLRIRQSLKTLIGKREIAEWARRPEKRNLVYFFVEIRKIFEFSGVTRCSQDVKFGKHAAEASFIRSIQSGRN